MAIRLWWPLAARKAGTLATALFNRSVSETLEKKLRAWIEDVLEMARLTAWHETTVTVLLLA